MLELQGIRKTFYPGTPNEKKALNGVDLHLNAGDFVTIVGSNGAGKSTLFNAISGVFSVDEGTIRLDSKNITNMKEYKRAYDIGRLFQDTMKGTAPNMTIEENLALAYSRKAGKSFFAVNKQDREYFTELLKQLDLGLESRMKAKVGQLSGGQRQAVSLLMSTISQPKLLLLDEHTAALDPATARKVLDITTRIVSEGRITTMMITHDMHLMLEYTPRALVFSDGQLIADRRASEVLCDPELIERAALKETSLFTLANQCEITPPEAFVERFIGEDREVRSHGR